MKNKIEKIYIGWEELGIMIDELKRKVKSSRRKFKNIYAVPRGGYILGVALSHYLKIPLVDASEVGLSTLVCDDISDTGQTLHPLRKTCKIACLYTTPWTNVTPDYYVRVKTHRNSWIIFPYEDRYSEGEK